MMLKLGDIVNYRSRTGEYTVPAIVTATKASLNEAGVEAWHASNGTKGVPPLTDYRHVHLTVFTPGLPGQRGQAEDFKGTRKDAPISENVAGSYQEWDVPESSFYPKDGTADPGSWFTRE